ncbi:K+/H+ antiporter subunit F [Paracoccus marinus]|uniref:K+/H+ antiporter subunit F n=1 Tax=Paracoccus marinus TaxID=288426 RepID=UPI00103BD498|nr:K+/H+ antiporter subunit F [Paracoccus marinus]GLS80380.1 K+/H+ antiporter subunit F [Paracoccus marinus]
MTAATVLSWVLVTSQICLVSALVLAGMRAIRGPRAQDRVTGLDTMYVCAMLLMVVTGMRQGTHFLFEAALVIGTLGFVATTAMAKFLMRGEVIE